MKKRDRRKHHRPERNAVVKLAPTAPPAGPARSWERWGWLVAGTLVIALAATVAYRMWPTEAPAEPVAKTKNDEEPGTSAPPSDGHAVSGHELAAQDSTKKSEPRSFLDEFGEGDTKTDKDH